MTGRGAHHSFEEHTSEILLCITAPTREELYAEAGRALAELLADDPDLTYGPVEPITVTARDAAALLVAWVDELVYRAETRGCVYPSVQVSYADDTRLEVSMRGGPPAEWRTAVKAATWHRLAVEPDGAGGWTATVVLDV